MLEYDFLFKELQQEAAHSQILNLVANFFVDFQLVIKLSIPSTRSVM